MTTITLFNSQVGSGTSPAVLVSYDEDVKDQARIVSVIVTSPSWNGADVTVEESHDGSTWAPYKAWDGSAMQTVTVEANCSLHIQLPFGAQFRLRNTDTGSPLSTINATALGPIALA